MKCSTPGCSNSAHPSYGTKCEDCWVGNQPALYRPYVASLRKYVGPAPKNGRVRPSKYMEGT